MAFFMIAVLMYASSYGPDSLVPSAAMPGGFLKQFIPVMSHRYVLIIDVAFFYFMFIFFIALVEMFTAMSTASWYFTRKKESANMPGLPSLIRVLRYHVGTVSKLTFYKFAFKLVRNFAGMLRAALRKANQDNNLIRFLMATFLPAITMYDKYLKFISKDLNALTAMWGEDYYNASRKSYFMTKFRHPKDGYQILGWISFILFSLKLSVSIVVGLLVYFYIYFFDQSPIGRDLTTVDTPIVPFVFTVLISLFLSSIWIAPYDMMIRTTLQCYSMDGEMFIGDQRFTEEFLFKMVDSLGELSWQIMQDRTFFCFACKRKRDEAASNRADMAEWTEDFENLKEEKNEFGEESESDEEDSPKKQKPKLGDERDPETGAATNSPGKKPNARKDSEDQLHHLNPRFDEDEFDRMTEMNSMKGSMKSKSSKLQKNKLKPKGAGAASDIAPKEQAKSPTLQGPDSKALQPEPQLPRGTDDKPAGKYGKVTLNLGKKFTGKGIEP